MTLTLELDSTPLQPMATTGMHCNIFAFTFISVHFFQSISLAHNMVGYVVLCHQVLVNQVSLWGQVKFNFNFMLETVFFTIRFGKMTRATLEELSGFSGFLKFSKLLVSSCNLARIIMTWNKIETMKCQNCINMLIMRAHISTNETPLA